MEEDKDKLNESFVSRWSKRKSRVVSSEDDSELEKNLKIEESKNNKISNNKDEESDHDELNDEELLEKFKLPNPDKIKKEKGLDVFFKDGVPDRLRQIALRRVWKLNPIIRFADAEINDYHEDFTDAATVVEGMQTAYQVGKGYISEMLENKEDDSSVKSTEVEKVDIKKSKKKTKSISRKKDENLKKEAHDKIEKTNNKIATIEEKDNKELVSTKPDKAHIEAVQEKPRPKMMVFKPKDNDNDYH